jgi:hypothetical protein
MRNDNSSCTSPPGELSLPVDFAQRVLLLAHKKLERRRRRRRIAAAAVLLFPVAAVPLAKVTRSLRDHLSVRHPAIVANRGWQTLSNDNALAYELVQTANPPSPADYLLPNASALGEIYSPYSQASWEYDPRWTYEP